MKIFFALCLNNFSLSFEKICFECVLNFTFGFEINFAFGFENKFDIVFERKYIECKYKVCVKFL